MLKGIESDNTYGAVCPCIQETVLAKEIKELIIVILSAQPPAKQNTETSFTCFFRPNTPNTKYIITYLPNIYIYINF